MENEPRLTGPIWLMQPIPYFGEELRERWAWEPKIDGWRLQMFRLEEGPVQLWGRRLETHPNWTEPLRDLSEAAGEWLPRGSLVDGELYSTGGRRWIRSLFARVRKAEPVVFVFDVVFWKGDFVGHWPYEKRKELVNGLPLTGVFHAVREKPLGRLEDAVREAVAAGHEGVVIKEYGSVYEVGRDGPLATAHWRKIKPVRR
ncbi:MAG: hypothetical protein GXO73_13775 [Calditrichaeota bacterium]|nr:hypothetical protein [Calditrichota bacterium]